MRVLTEAPRRREHAIELGVFLFLIVPSLVLPIFAVRCVSETPFTFAAAATIFSDLAFVALILFFLWRNAESVARIGWIRRRVAREVALGVALFIPFAVAAAALEAALRSIGLSSITHAPRALSPGQSPWQTVLAAALVFVVAVSEETIFRGYILTRLCESTRSTALALLLSAGVFAIGHAYEGSAGVVTIGTMGAVFGLIFLWRKSIVAPIAMHFLQDFIGIVLAPHVRT